ncbi:hypothetical protein ABAC460_12880 [Asticcacaulis sp. AC460]|uniref:PDR/VanB family oxidoreductase n=1 Tax=Asticcacaulis sp. AC460 TaxID=1282360 RepID=UPI0003C3D11B|nr:PDR/VanB family oxidoreductase [Asticcacaulis sp. AC460]ESQ89399.1 hypothetical protein ABAC460_12880 [Asticcacaulis sp. AC460]
MIEVVVTQILQATANIRRITLAAADGSALPPFDAGAHIDVHLPNGLIRQYSLTGLPGEARAYHLGVLKDPHSRGGSQWLHDRLKTGDPLRVSAPRNLFPLHGTAKQHRLFAGGIGITPILAMARHLSASGADFEVHYCVRNRAEAAFADDLASLRSQGRVRLTEGRETARLDYLDALAAPTSDAHLYVCGPDGYIRTVLDLARQQGWTQAQLHKEAFTAQPLADSDDPAFRVRLARSGITVSVAPGQSVVKALEAHGVFIPVSCEQGICGTCLTPVVSGTPDHRDQYLTDDERAANDQFTPCCSRALSSELVLDI